MLNSQKGSQGMSSVVLRPPQSQTFVPDDRSITDQAVDALRSGLGDQLVAVVLLGSRARGDARPASDWDLLVIAEGLPDRVFDRKMYLKRLLPLSCLVAVSIIAHRQREFEASVPSLYLDIALDGRIMYDPRGYVAKRLATLQRIMHKRGLGRERTPDGDLWSAAKPKANVRQLG
jgi:uncharacterized protein